MIINSNLHSMLPPVPVPTLRAGAKLQIKFDLDKEPVHSYYEEILGSESEKIKIAIKSLGLDDLKPFNPKERIIEYLLEDGSKKLVDLKLNDFNSRMCRYEKYSITNRYLFFMSNVIFWTEN